uniref:Major capsid protein n=1 Tax=Parastrongyloides trichosuri TaxID=131310 RepID=A0A0N4ZHB3_PARTI
MYRSLARWTRLGNADVLGSALFYKFSVLGGNEPINMLMQPVLQVAVDAPRRTALLNMFCDDVSLLVAAMQISGVQGAHADSSCAYNVGRAMSSNVNLTTFFNNAQQLAGNSVFHNSYFGFFKNFAKDNAIMATPQYISAQGSLNGVFSTALLQYSDDVAMGNFLQTFALSRGVMMSSNPTLNLLDVVYSAHTESLLQSYVAEVGSGVNDLRNGVAGITAYDHEAAMGIFISSLAGVVIFPHDFVDVTLSYERFALGEHHLYGSSRLGTRNYTGDQLYHFRDNRVRPAIVDTTSLKSRVPWYSYAYNEVINPVAKEVWGNGYTGRFGVQHTLGQKQYEVNDHLGNVMVTVSDHPFSIAGTGAAIRFKRAALRAAYDYYPFGMLMPGRYVNDTADRCFYVSKSVWVPGMVPWIMRASDLSLGMFSTVGGSSMTFSAQSVQMTLPLNSHISYRPEVIADEENRFVVSMAGYNGTMRIEILDSLSDGSLLPLTSVQVGQSNQYELVFRPSGSYVIARFSLITGATGVLNIADLQVFKPSPTQQTILVRVCEKEGDNYRFGYSSHEKLNEVSGIGNTIDMGDRWVDTRIGRTPKLDKAAKEYPSISPYAYVMNTPIWAKDPDGKRVYFVGGAGNDPVSQGWNYIDRFKCIWTNLGIEDFTRVNATHGKTGDMLFVETYRNNSQRPVGVGYKHAGWIPVTTEKQLQRAVNGIVDDITSRPLKKGEQLNMAGYSYGAVLQAHATVELIKKGYKVDNLILIASPTSDNSDLMKTLQQYKKAGKLGNIIRKDIKGDDLSNPGGLRQYLNGIKQGAVEGDDAHHFDMARPGEEADKKIEQTGKELQQKGVK